MFPLPVACSERVSNSDPRWDQASSQKGQTCLSPSDPPLICESMLCIRWKPGLGVGSSVSLNVLTLLLHFYFYRRQGYAGPKVLEMFRKFRAFMLRTIPSWKPHDRTLFPFFCWILPLSSTIAVRCGCLFWESYVKSWSISAFVHTDMYAHHLCALNLQTRIYQL